MCWVPPLGILEFRDVFHHLLSPNRGNLWSKNMIKEKVGKNWNKNAYSWLTFGTGLMSVFQTSSCCETWNPSWTVPSIGGTLHIVLEGASKKLLRYWVHSDWHNCKAKIHENPIKSMVWIASNCRILPVAATPFRSRFVEWLEPSPGRARSFSQLQLAFKPQKMCQKTRRSGIW